MSNLRGTANSGRWRPSDVERRMILRAFGVTYASVEPSGDQAFPIPGVLSAATGVPSAQTAPSR
jgi:hypothetical protein